MKVRVLRALEHSIRLRTHFRTCFHTTSYSGGKGVHSDLAKYPTPTLNFRSNALLMRLYYLFI